MVQRSRDIEEAKGKDGSGAASGNTETEKQAGMDRGNITTGEGFFVLNVKGLQLVDGVLSTEGVAEAEAEPKPKAEAASCRHKSFSNTE